MATDRQVVKDADTGLIESLISLQQAAVAGITPNQQAALVQQQKDARLYAFYKVAADAMASTATAETATPWLGTNYQGKVFKVIITPTAALTGDPTNNAVITVFQRNAAGGAQLAVATLTTTASWVAGVAVSMVLTPANLQLIAGGSLTITITKGGTGVVVPISMITVFVEEN